MSQHNLLTHLNKYYMFNVIMTVSHGGKITFLPTKLTSAYFIRLFLQNPASWQNAIESRANPNASGDWPVYRHQLLLQLPVRHQV